MDDGIHITWLLVFCWPLCFEAVVAFGVLSCLSREMCLGFAEIDRPPIGKYLNESTMEEF